MKSGFGKLVYVEGKKIMHSSLFRLSFLILLAGNLFIMFLYEKGIPFSTESYRTFKQEYEMLGDSEKERLSRATEQCDKQLVIERIKLETEIEEPRDWHHAMSYTIAKEMGYSEKWYWNVRKEYGTGKNDTYSDKTESQNKLYASIKEELEQIATYHDNIASIQQKAEDKKSIKIIWKNQTAYSKRELEKEEKDYQRISQVTPVFVGSIGLSRVLGNVRLDICSCLMITIISSLLFIEEKKNGNFKLYRATLNGRGNLFWAKTLIQIVLSAITILLYWGSCFLYSWKSYGGVSLSAPVQSILGYQNCTMMLTIGQYIIVYLLVKLFALSVIAAIGTVISIIAANYVTYYWGTGILYLIGVIGYTGIPKYRAFSWLRQLNIIYFMQGTAMVKEYLNFDILGYAVNHRVVCLAAGGAILFFAFIFGEKCYTWCETGYHSFDLVSLGRKGYHKKKANTSLFLHEFYKVLIGNKVLFLLAATSVILFLSAEKQHVSLTEEENYYQIYMKRLEGRVTDDKRNYIAEEEERIKRIEHKIEELYIEFEHGDISETTLKENVGFLEQRIKGKNAFERVKERLAYLDEPGKERYRFVYEDGWKQLFGLTDDGRKNDLLSALFCVLLITISISGCMAGDFESGMFHLQTVSVKGRKSLLLRKMLNIILILLVIMVTVYAREVILVHKKYGLSSLLTQAKSIPEMGEVIGSNGTILQHCLVVFGVRFIGYLLVLLIMYLLALSTKSTMKTMVLTIVLFALPIAISLLGIQQLDSYSLNHVLCGNPLL